MRWPRLRGDETIAVAGAVSGCGGGAGFTVDYLIVLGLDACDCTPSEVLFQVVDNAGDFADLNADQQRLGWYRKVRTSGILNKVYRK